MPYLRLLASFGPEDQVATKRLWLESPGDICLRDAPFACSRQFGVNDDFVVVRKSLISMAYFALRCFLKYLTIASSKDAPLFVWAFESSSSQPHILLLDFLPNT